MTAGRSETVPSRRLPSVGRRARAGAADYLWKLLNDIQQWALWPVPVRRIFLRAAGMKIHSTAGVAERVYLGGRDVQLGIDVYVNVGSFIDGSASVIVGDYTRIGPFVRILTGTHVYRDSVIRRRREDGTVGRPVVIERGCWIGMAASLMPGVTIAEGCVVAAGSVVTQSTVANGLYAGTPAVRKRELSIVADGSPGDAGRNG